MAVPDVTVVIPTYQRWHLIGRTLRCALDQEGVNVEVVIVSDGEQRMPDDLLEPGEERVRVLYPGQSGGVGPATNIGIEAATAEWVALLDDDDLWPADKLARQLAAAKAEDAAWVFSSAVAVDEQMRPMELFRAPEASTLMPGLLEYQLVPAGCSNVVARTDFLRSLGGMDVSFHQLTDWDLWIRMAAAERAATIDDIQVAYVQHPESMLLTHPDWVFKEFNLLRRKHRDLGRRYGQKVNAEGYGFWVSNRLQLAGFNGRAIKASLYAGLRYGDPGLVLNAARVMLGRPPQTPTPPSSSPDWVLKYAAS